MAFQIQFKDLVLDDFEEWAEQNDSRIQEHRIPRRQGSLAPQVASIDSRTITLVGHVWANTSAELQTKMKTLRNTLAFGRGRLVLYDDLSFLNVLKARFHNAYRAREIPSLHSSVVIEFLADDPYWYAPASSSPLAELSGVSAAFAINNPGLAPTPPVFEITRSAGTDQNDITLTQTTTGLFLKWVGALAVGQSVIFDCVNKTVLAAGGKAMNAFVPGSIDMELVPGLNNFHYSGPGDVDILTHFRERWL